MTGSRYRLLALDVDGVLTDGSLYVGDADGMDHLRFHVHDGYGLKRLQDAGIRVVVVTGRKSAAVSRRLAELGITDVIQGVTDKEAALGGFLASRGIPWDQVAYVGDDVTDLPVLRRVGFAATVSDAIPEVRQVVGWTCRQPGGRGAVREVCDRLLEMIEDGAPTTIGVVPARFGSTRFPGKPLVSIGGVPMVVRVARQALRARHLAGVVVATDDDRILSVCVEHGIEGVMTACTHRSGTDRLAEVARLRVAPFYLNIQGDEPLVSPELLDDVVDALVQDPGVDIATAARPFDDALLASNPNVVKVVVDRRGNALYFSRSPIPAPRPTHRAGWLHHVGVYAYRREALLRMAELPPSPLEIAESLEQLRALEDGMGIRVVRTSHEGVGVDTPEDVARVEALLAEEAR